MIPQTAEDRAQARFSYGYNVAVFSFWPLEVVFHDPRTSADRRHDDHRWVTVCGLEIQRWNGETGSPVRENGTLVPTHHAIKIGRACRRCYP